MVLQQLLQLDAQIFNAINSFNNPALDFLFSNISHLGSIFLWGILCVVLLIKKDKKLFTELALTIGLVALISGGLKLSVNRPRPFDSLENVHLLDPKPDPSFPSNHAANAFAGAGIFSKYYKKFTFAFYMLAVLVAVSRIYVGAHYPSDVFAGALLGLGISWAVKKYSLAEKAEKFLHSVKIKKIVKKYF